MRLNPYFLHVGHLVVAAGLTSLVWILHRRLRAARQLMTTLETELGLVKKRYEAATAGFHVRLLLLEKQAKAAGIVASAAPAGRGIRTPAAVPLPWRPAEQQQMNRGEWDLRRKIRQLGQD